MLIKAVYTLPMIRPLQPAPPGNAGMNHQRMIKGHTRPKCPPVGDCLAQPKRKRMIDIDHALSFWLGQWVPLPGFHQLAPRARRAPCADRILAAFGFVLAFLDIEPVSVGQVADHALTDISTIPQDKLTRL